LRKNKWLTQITDKNKNIRCVANQLIKVSQPEKWVKEIINNKEKSKKEFLAKEGNTKP